MESPSKRYEPSSVTRRLGILRRFLLPYHRSPRDNGPQQPVLELHHVMHSSQVRDGDFNIWDRGTVTDVQSLLPSITSRTRVGILAPETGTEAAGAGQKGAEKKDPWAREDP